MAIKPKKPAAPVEAAKPERERVEARQTKGSGIPFNRNESRQTKGAANRNESRQTKGYSLNRNESRQTKRIATNRNESRQTKGGGLWSG